jgi:hypothetical protein
MRYHTIFRVEHEDTRDGPYWNGWARIWEDELYDLDGNHPSPIREGVICDLREMQARSGDPDVRFGFPSIDLFNRWFHSKPLCDALVRDGYVLAEYEVNARDCVMTDTQAFFYRPYADHVQDHAPNNPPIFD